MKISPATVFAGFPEYLSIKRFLVAYSGGLDSHVLLHLVAHARESLNGVSLVAVHINHGLSPNALQWEQHCAAQCEQLHIPFHVITVNAKPALGESPEAAAREARYQAFRVLMAEGDCLLTAHHQDDQAETLLLQLLRGAGPKGLAAMPAVADFAAGWHVRPLLTVRRNDLLDYAHQHQLSWIDDESNFDTGHDRNFIRHEIMPRLKSRFPAAAETISRSAGLCAEAADLLNHQAAIDLEYITHDAKSLSISGLKAMGEVRCRNVLHHWLHNSGLSLPTSAQMQRIWQDVICSAEDSCPVVSWPGGEIRRYRDELLLGLPLADFDHQQVYAWDLAKDLMIDGLGVLGVKPMVGQGIAARHIANKSLLVQFRQGGEEIQPAGRQGHHALKKLFQEAGIPPWQRQRIPLLYADDVLIAVAGFWIAEEVAAAAGETGMVPAWTPVHGD